MNLRYALGCGLLALAIAGCGGHDEDAGSPTIIHNTTTPAPQNTTVVVPPSKDKTVNTSTTTITAPKAAGSSTTSGAETAGTLGPPKKGEPVPGDQTTGGTGQPENTAALVKGALPGWKCTTKRQTTASGLQYIDCKVGSGQSPKLGDDVYVNYTGYLTDGTKFDSSFDHPDAFHFPIGQGQVIKGWDEGVGSMKVGGKRKLIVPSDLAYGATPPPGAPIPPNATLVFDVELVKIGS